MVTSRHTTLANALRKGTRHAAIASGCVIALAGSALAATPTYADDRQITAADQAYFSYYHLDAARAKGYTGKGSRSLLLTALLMFRYLSLRGQTSSIRHHVVLKQPMS